MTPFMLVAILAIAMANDHKPIIKHSKSVIGHIAHFVKKIK